MTDNFSDGSPTSRHLKPIGDFTGRLPFRVEAADEIARFLRSSSSDTEKKLGHGGDYLAEHGECPSDQAIGRRVQRDSASSELTDEQVVRLYRSLEQLSGPLNLLVTNEQAADLIRAEAEVRSEVSGDEAEGVAHSATTGQQLEGFGAGRGGVKWEQASTYMIEMRNRGERFTSQPDMANRLGCSPATIHKAIDRTDELKEWTARPAYSATGMQSLDGIVADSTPQQREPDPTNIVEDEDVDEALQYLMERVEPEEKARINTMDPASKRELAETVYRDPDREEQVMRWRNSRPRKG